MKLNVYVSSLDQMTSIPVDVKRSLLQNLLDHHINIPHSCGGHGTCGTCRITVLDTQDVLPPDEVEQEFWAERRQNDTHQRLACQTYLNRDSKNDAVPIKVEHLDEPS